MLACKKNCDSFSQICFDQQNAKYIDYNQITKFMMII